MSDSSARPKTLVHKPKSSTFYDSLKDPTLQAFFQKPMVRSHLMENGWFAANAECSICKKKNRGDIRLCVACNTFTHVNCITPLPLKEATIKLLIMYFLPIEADISFLIKLCNDSGHFSDIQELNIRKTRPTLKQLQGFDSVLVFGLPDDKSKIHHWKEPDFLGDLLASYVLGTNDSKKGGVVLGPMTHGLGLGGRWRKQRLNPLLPGRAINSKMCKMGKIEMEGHPLLQSSSCFTGGECSYRVAGAVNENGANTVLRWEDGLPLLVVLDGHSAVQRGRVVSINFLPASKVTDQQPLDHFWDPCSSGNSLLINALRFVAHPTYEQGGGMFKCEPCKKERAKEPNHISFVKKLYEETPRQKKVTNEKYSSHDVQDFEALKQIYRDKFKKQIDESINKKNAVLSTSERLKKSQASIQSAVLQSKQRIVSVDSFKSVPNQKRKSIQKPPPLSIKSTEREFKGICPSPSKWTPFSPEFKNANMNDAFVDDGPLKIDDTHMESMFTNPPIRSIQAPQAKVSFAEKEDNEKGAGSNNSRPQTAYTPTSASTRTPRNPPVIIKEIPHATPTSASTRTPRNPTVILKEIPHATPTKRNSRRQSAHGSSTKPRNPPIILKEIPHATPPKNNSRYESLKSATGTKDDRTWDKPSFDHTESKKMTNIGEPDKAVNKSSVTPGTTSAGNALLSHEELKNLTMYSKKNMNKSIDIADSTQVLRRPKTATGSKAKLVSAEVLSEAKTTTGARAKVSSIEELSKPKTTTGSKGKLGSAEVLSKGKTSSGSRAKVSSIEELSKPKSATGSKGKLGSAEVLSKGKTSSGSRAKVSSIEELSKPKSATGSKGKLGSANTSEINGFTNVNESQMEIENHNLHLGGEIIWSSVNM